MNEKLRDRIEEIIHSHGEDTIEIIYRSGLDINTRMKAFYELNKKASENLEKLVKDEVRIAYYRGQYSCRKFELLDMPFESFILMQEGKLRQNK